MAGMSEEQRALSMTQREIPQWSRYLVENRDNHLCARCFTSGRRVPLQWHHRRSRAVPGPHRHCPCNGLLLCGTCHLWVHSHPTEALAKGLIVSRSERHPFEVPLRAMARWVSLHCDGGYDFLWNEQVQMDVDETPTLSHEQLRPDG